MCWEGSLWAVHSHKRKASRRTWEGLASGNSAPMVRAHSLGISCVAAWRPWAVATGSPSLSVLVRKGDSHLSDT